MADDLPPIDDEDQGLLAETAVTNIVVEEEVMPDWLEGSLDEDWDGEEKTAVEATVPDESEAQDDKQAEEKAVGKKKETRTKEKKPAKSKASSEDKLNYILIGLIIFVIIIIFILAYLITNM